MNYSKELMKIAKELDIKVKPNKLLFNKWKKIVINKGENSNSYDNKKPEQWDVDDFVGFIENNIDSSYEITDKNIAKIFGISNIDVSKLTATGLNNDKNWNKYETWRSALYDIWESLI